MKRKISLAILGLVAVALFVVLAMSGPVLFRVNGNIARQRAWFIMNPLRDRAPERPAEAFLKDVSEGRCQEAAMRLAGRLDPKCERDTELRILSWRLQAREDHGSDNVRLLYEVIRDFGARGHFEDPYWFDVKQSVRGGPWKVVTIDRIF